jgi:hypothetical protein
MPAAVSDGKLRFDYPTVREKREGWGTLDLWRDRAQESLHSFPNLPQAKLSVSSRPSVDVLHGA